jgi:hypothetical protein
VNSSEPWGAALYGDPCRECRFEWAISPEDAIALTANIPERYRMLLANANGYERHPDLSWNASAYVSHVADNLRMWAERLAGIRISGQRRAPGYDQDLLAEARHYNEIDKAAALWALDHAVTLWVENVSTALTLGLEMDHATRGLQTASDIARNNTHDAYHHGWDIERILAHQP